MMDTVKDIIPLDGDFPVRIFRTRGSLDHSRSLHRHDCLEIDLVVSGSGFNIIGTGSYDLHAGDVYVINHLEPHYAFSYGELELLVIEFEASAVWMNNHADYDYLRPFFDRTERYSNRMGIEEPGVNGIATLMAEMETEFRISAPGSKLVIKALLLKILALINRSMLGKGQLGNERLEHKKEYDRIRPSLDFINGNYTNELRLEEIAERSYMTPTYFSNYFKGMMKITLQDYIMKLRINHACRLLKQSDLSVTEVGMESGFTCISHFNRSFKKYMGLSPGAYRNKM